MEDSAKVPRRHERKQLSLPVRVRGHESVDSEWNEITRFIDLSPFGGRFVLQRLTETGRILHLTVAMPRQYRCFDHAEDQYRVWSLVRWTAVLEPVGDDEMRLDVGVAFVGKNQPTSYVTNPMSRYDVAFSADTREMPKVTEHPHSESFSSSADRREEPRYHISIDASLEVLDTSGHVIRTEITVTEEVSRKGASVYTEFKVPKGQFVRLTSSQFKTSVIAVVRAVYNKNDNLTRLGLEYINGRLPLAGIE